MLNYIKYFIIFFFLFYLEPIIIYGNLTFSQIWKIPFIIFSISFIIYKRYYKKSFSGISFLYSIKNIFNESLFTNPITNLIETFRYLNFFVIYELIRLTFFKSKIYIFKILVRISQYFILSNIPFLLGILRSRKDGIIFGERLSFVGIFQNPHAASVILSFSTILLINNLHNFKKFNFLKLYNIILISFGLVCISLSFVRTGYLITFLGLFIILHPNNKYKIYKYYIFIFFTLFFIFYYINSNAILRNRIYDLNKYGNQLRIGSGRIEFASISYDYWSKGDIFILFFGRGLDNIKNNLFNKTGMRIFSHNGFVDALTINGLIGIFLFILSFFFIFKFILKQKKSNYFRINLTFIVMYLSYQLTQGGVTFGTDIFLALSLNLLSQTKYE